MTYIRHGIKLELYKVTLKVNEEKMEYMVLRRQNLQLCQSMKIGHCGIKKVN